MSAIYKHGVIDNDENKECTEIKVNKPYSLTSTSLNTYNDRLIYDIPTCDFKPTADPIDDRIRKNMLLIDWVKRLDSYMFMKYSYEKFTDEEQKEIYLYLSSKVLAREAVNFLTILITTPKAVYTEYYSSIRDIYTFLRDAGQDRTPCMIQIAAILMTLYNDNIIPINPTWGFIRTPKVEISYGFVSQIYKITTEHIIVLQSSTNYIRQRDNISSKTIYNIFASTVGLHVNKYSSIMEWLLLNCDKYYPKPNKKFAKPLFMQPLTIHKPGSYVFIEGMSDTMVGVLLNNSNADYCSILIYDGYNTYIEHNVMKSLVTVSQNYVSRTGTNLFSVC